MQGTAVSEAPHFQEQFGLEVVQVPPHRRLQRQDAAPLIYYNSSNKIHVRKHSAHTVMHECQSSTSSFLSYLL